MTWRLIACDHGDGLWGFGWADFLGGIAAGLIATGIVWVATSLLRRKRNRDAFGPLIGTYKVTRKHPSDQPDGEVTIKGDGPILTLDWTLASGSRAEGTLAMNEQSRITGAGSYEHVQGAPGWGYLTVHVASRKKGAARLLVDGRYTREAKRDEVSTAWVWEMPSAPAGDGR